MNPAWNRLYICFFVAAVTAAAGWAQTERIRFYRVRSPEPARIIQWDSSGRLSWTNAAGNTPWQIESTPVLGSSWTSEVFLRRLEPSGITGAVRLAVADSNFWAELQTNPVIHYGQTLDGMIWNDPCVIFEDGRYRMWLSGGTGLGINPVGIYLAESGDGIHWTIHPSPLLERSATAGDWDDEKVETPVVVKVNGIYHLYYSGFKTGDGAGRYQTGHATSGNGVDWVKDPANPVLSYHDDPGRWGYYMAAEPGAVYDPQRGTFFLYYVTARARPGYTGDLAFQQGIALATSTDGSTFTPYDPDHDGELNPVLVQSAGYPVGESYVGYSTPYALMDSGGTIQLFYDVAQFVAGGDWRQVALARAVSADGVNFQEVETNLFVYGTGDWKDYEVRAPSVIQEGPVFKMWFAGNNELFFQPGFMTGIGCAVYGGDWKIPGN